MAGDSFSYNGSVVFCNKFLNEKKQPIPDENKNNKLKKKNDFNLN